MAKQTNDYQPIGFRMSGVLLETADTDVEKLLVEAGMDDSTVNQFSIRNAGSVPETVEILLYDGAVFSVMETVVIPASAGTNGVVPAYDVLSLEIIYNANLLLAGGWSIYARAKTTVTGSLTFLVILTDY